MMKLPAIVEKFLSPGIFSKKSDAEMLPSVNISDEDKAFEVSIALPGLDKKDVRIEIQNNCLIISSEKEHQQEEKNKNWIRKEYYYGTFRRVFELPENADENKVQAQMKNGLLHIAIAKKYDLPNARKRISIQ